MTDILHQKSRNNHLTTKIERNGHMDCGISGGSHRNFRIVNPLI